jgi:hypothetical protein
MNYQSTGDGLLAELSQTIAGSVRFTSSGYSFFESIQTVSKEPGGLMGHANTLSILGLEKHLKPGRRSI